MRKNSALFLASFMTLIAAGMGFAIRGGVLADWEAQFGFTKTELGTITGGGLVGFGITIIACSLIADRVGYKPLMVLAFLLHAASAVVTLSATPVFNAYGKETTYWVLYVGMFLFALANGVCESVINPLVATLYPRQKTHYLNILHAGWPGGLILGGLLGYLLVGADAPYRIMTGSRGFWEIPMALFLLPTLFYGIVILKETFPLSETRAAGVTFGQMLREFAAPVLLLLLLLHAMVGYVELGTDSWITNIMEQALSGNAILVLVYTAGIMFVLRFFAGPIVERINPLGLLLASAVIGCIGLFWLGSLSLPEDALQITSNGVVMIFVAATVYGFGKAFLWPTMLGVVGERFPRGGAVTMGAIGGVGMLSAGLLGGPGIGYTNDHFAAEQLREYSEPLYDEYAAQGWYSVALEEFVSDTEMVDGEWPERFGEVELRPKPNHFLFLPPVTGLDGSKVAEIRRKTYDVTDNEAALTQEEEWVYRSSFYGGRMALKVTSAVPAMMAVGYLILVIYFWSIGGYKPVIIHEPGAEGEEYTGGVEGPVR